jgi:methyl-accepting chemotaxis protein
MIISHLGVALISLASIVFISYQLARYAMIKEAGETLNTLAQSQSITVGNEVTKQIELMTTLAQSPSLQAAVNKANNKYRGDEVAIRARIDQLDQEWRTADAANDNADPLVKGVLSNVLSTELANFQISNPNHVEAFVTDKYGASMASTGRTSDYNQADEEWWQAAYNNGNGALYIGQPEYDGSSQSFAINFGVPIKNEDGEVIGVLRSTYTIQGLQQILASVRFGETGQVDLVFPGGEVIGSATDKTTIDPTVLSRLKENTDKYSLFTYRDHPQVVSLAQVVSVTPEENLIETLDWHLVVYQDTAEVMQPVSSLMRNTLLTSLGVFLFATILAIIAARSLASPITRLTAVTSKLAAGDLSVQAEVRSNDEIGELAKTFNHMTDQLRQNMANEQAQHKYVQETIARYADFTTQVMQGRLTARLPINGHNQDDPLVQLGKSLNEMTTNLHRMITQTREAANNLSAAATEILAATSQQASGATEQSAAITQTTSTVDEVKTISEHSSSRLNEVASTSQRTVEVTRAGQKSVQEMIESMAQIKERVEAIAENTLALSEQTQQIGEIITTVNEIAAQSNILALNASVEAARAGEHGKGFAVVAMEVRNLAEQSKQATAQVRTILSEIQKATNLTVMATEEGAKGVDEGVLLAAQARESIEKLSGAVNEATQVATQVVAGGQQLQTGIEQIAMAIQQISQVTVQSLASTRQTEKSAQTLNDLARRLNEDIALYEL